MNLAGACNKKMMRLKQSLDKSTSNKVGFAWTKATMQLFEDISQCLCGLISLALGCDIFKGIKRYRSTEAANAWSKIRKSSKTTEDIIE